MIASLPDTTIDWEGVAESLMAEGYAVTPPLLSGADCERLRRAYDDPDTGFRATIDMARYNFGRGQYKYFAYPLPAGVQALRRSLYAGLAPVANAWDQCFGRAPGWPSSLDELTSRCHAAGQCRPTLLLLRYGAGDFNCLHQDSYGDIHFPLQAIVMLSAPQSDFEGGELVLVEQRPRMQSRPIVVPLAQGTAAIIPVQDRPRRGARGFHRARVRHGVSQVTAGNRHTLGIIFHDAT